MSRLSKLVYVFVSFFISAQAIAQAVTHSLPLGWSMVGNDTGANIDPIAVFGNASSPISSISPDVAAVWTWSNASSKWNFFAPSLTAADLSTYAAANGYSPLTSIPPGAGFWVNVTTGAPVSTTLAMTTTAQTYSFPAGWNLVGNETGANIDPATLGSSVQTVWTWNNSTGQWNFFSPSMFAYDSSHIATTLSTYATAQGYAVLTAIQPGEGFWVNAGAAPTVATAATAIAQAKNLLVSLRTNANLLGGSSGFLQTQVSTVLSDVTASQNAFSEGKEFMKFMLDAVSLLRSGNVTSGTSSGSPALKTSFASGYPWPCVAWHTGGTATGTVTGVGTAVCQWMHSDVSGTVIATHQLTVTGATTLAGSTSGGSYTYTEAIIGESSNGSPTSGGSNLGAVITLPLISNDYTYTGLTSTNNGPVGSPYITTSPIIGVSPTGTLALTGTLIISNYNLAPGSNPTLTLNGSALPGAVPASPISSPAIIDHVQFNNLTGTITVSAVTAGTQGTFSFGGSISRVATDGSTVNSITLGSGTNVVEIMGNQGHPVSGNVVLNPAATPNYQFLGTLNMSSFAQDKAAYCSNWNVITGVCSTWVPMPNWYPKSTILSGPGTGGTATISGINANSSLGTFMTGSMTMTRDESLYNHNYWESSTNYKKQSATFNGSITTTTTTPPMTYKVNVCDARDTLACNVTATAWNKETVVLTYTDPSPTTVTVTETSTTTVNPDLSTTTKPSAASAVMGGITITPGMSGSDPLGTIGDISAVIGGVATQIGYINGGFVYFSDGSFQSLK